MDYLNDFEDNFDIDVKYKDFRVRAAFGQDRESTLGVHRLTDVEVEIDNISEKVEDEIRNCLAGYECFVEDSNWREDAENTIIQCIEKVMREEI